MRKKVLIQNLTLSTQNAVSIFLDKIKLGKPLKAKDVGMLGVNMDSCLQLHVLKAMAIVRDTIRRWHNEGCTRNEDGSYNLPDVIKWRINKEKKKQAQKGDPKRDIEIEKLTAQTEKLKIEIGDMQKKTIPREKVEEIMRKQAIELNLYLTEGYKRNGTELMMKIKESETLRAFLSIMDEFFKEMMDNFVKGGEDI